ncbi:MAG: hypothetical protein JWO52_4083 [Gammaproteobacteria bacterium]|nr:hypothetical protein [Gammaproteobacteria bacterium]
MVRNSKQTWEVGRTVKVGFLPFKIVAAIPTPNDSLPDLYFLTNLAGDKLYQFIPHQGLTPATLDDVASRVAAYRQHVEHIAAAQISKAAKASQIRSTFDALFAEVA